MYFKQDSNGLFVGYHFEGGENYEEAGSVRLSLETLDNNRVLFMGDSPEGGWRDTEFTPDGRLYEIHFKQVKIHPPFKSFDEYINLTDLSMKYGSAGHRIRKGSKLDKLVKEGYRVFCMMDNDRDETHEGFLALPKESVVSIVDITHEIDIRPLFERINT